MSMRSHAEFGDFIKGGSFEKRAVRRARDDLHPIYPIAMFLLGFSIPFPGLLLPNQLFSPRYTDFLIVLCIPLAWILYLRDNKTYGAHKTVLLWTAGLIIAFVVQALTFRGMPQAGDWVFNFRWMASILVAAPLCYVLPGRRDLQRTLLLGIVIGSALHVLTIFIGTAGGTDFLRQVGFASRRVMERSYYGESRITSLAEHPNVAMVLLGTAVPAAFAYRLLSPPKEGRVLMAIAIVVTLAGFYLTLGRAATIAAFLAFLAAQLQMAKRRERVAKFFPTAFMVLAAIAVAFGAYASGVQIEADRIAERIASKGLEQNLEGRAATIEGTIDLVFKYPLGTGWGQYLVMREANHLEASHNGYLFATRTAGILLALLLLVGHVRLIWKMAFTRRIDALAPFGVFLIVVMFASDLTQGMSLTFLTVLLAMAGFRGVPWASVTYRSVLVPWRPRSASAEQIPVKDDRT